MKRSIGIGLAALLAICAIAPGAMAQGRAPARGAAAAPAVFTPSAKDVEKGMADVPGLLGPAGLACTPTTAYYVGGSVTDAKTKARTDAYEVVCSEGMGFAIVAATGSAPRALNCLQLAVLTAEGKPQNLTCKLPDNANVARALQPYVTKGGVGCTVAKGRSIGTTPDAAYFEVGCADGKGYVVQTSALPTPAKDVVTTTCLAFEPGTSLACTLTDRTAELAVVDTLNTAANKSCAVKDKRYILTTRTGANYFEVACNDGKGYVFEQAANGAFSRSIDCAEADFVGGGCKLTDARAAQTEQNALYTRLAKAAGYNCDVSKYGTGSPRPGLDVVELQCSNRPDGAVALFGRDAASTKVYDCVEAEIGAGMRCSFTKFPPLYAKLSASLKAVKPDTTCQVSEARVLNAATADEGFVELACSDGLAGYVIGLSKTDLKPKSVLTCAQARGIGTGCTLATNVNPRRG